MQDFDLVEFVRFDPLDQLVVERLDLTRHPKGAVAHMTAGAPRDLPEFGGIEIAELIAVEFAVLRKGDMIDIEIEAHADRIGRDQIFDIARLVERNLGIAGARG